MVVASPALLWQLTRKRSSRAAKRTHPKLAVTFEKGSLTAARRAVDSGLCTERAVDVDADENGVPVLAIKSTKPCAGRKPDKLWRTTTLSGGVRKALARTERQLATYRPAATKLALRKVSAIYKAQQRKNKGITHASIKTGRTVEKAEE